jgi:hypothetical protein
MLATPNLRQIARAFTRPVFAELARTGNSDVARELLQAPSRSKSRNSIPLGQAYEAGWTLLAEQYRNEYVYKNELAARLIFSRHSPRTAGFAVELNIGKSIVDVAVANGTSTAYEIKTEYDSCRRLNTQTADYLKAFDKVYVVTHPDYVERYAQELDSRVGLISLFPGSSLRPHREAISNAQNVDPRIIFRRLRRAEYLAAIRAIFGEQPDIPSGLIDAHCDKLFSTLSPVEAHKVFVKALKGRTTDKNTVDFISVLPPSLKALGFATPLSGRQRETLKEVLISR